MAHTPFDLRSIFDLIAVKIFSIADRHQLQFWLPMEVASPTQKSVRQDKLAKDKR